MHAEDPKSPSLASSLGKLHLVASALIHGEGDGTPLQDSCLENPMDRGAWQATAHGVAKSKAERLQFTLLKTTPQKTALF